MPQTDRIVELLRIMEGRGYWTPEEQREVEEIIEMGGGFEIEGLWSDEGGEPRPYDKPPKTARQGEKSGSPLPEPLLRPETPPAPEFVADYDARLKTMEHAMADVMRRLKALEERAGVGKGQD